MLCWSPLGGCCGCLRWLLRQFPLLHMPIQLWNWVCVCKQGSVRCSSLDVKPNPQEVPRRQKPQHQLGFPVGASRDGAAAPQTSPSRLMACGDKTQWLCLKVAGDVSLGTSVVSTPVWQKLWLLGSLLQSQQQLKSVWELDGLDQTSSCLNWWTKAWALGLATWLSFQCVTWPGASNSLWIASIPWLHVVFLIAVIGAWDYERVLRKDFLCCKGRRGEKRPAAAGWGGFM